MNPHNLLKKHKIESNVLLDFLANACYYAQEHIDDPHAWSKDRSDREQWLGCVSYQVACFLSQNTVKGDEGVDWDVVITELTDPVMKSRSHWRKIIQKKVKELGGWNGKKSVDKSKKLKRPDASTKPELALVEVLVWRNPTKNEIKFGRGCTIRKFVMLPNLPSLRPKTVVVDGVKWNVPH